MNAPIGLSTTAISAMAAAVWLRDVTTSVASTSSMNIADNMNPGIQPMPASGDRDEDQRTFDDQKRGEARLAGRSLPFDEAAIGG